MTDNIIPCTGNSGHNSRPLNVLNQCKSDKPLPSTCWSINYAKLNDGIDTELPPLPKWAWKYTPKPPHHGPSNIRQAASRKKITETNLDLEHLMDNNDTPTPSQLVLNEDLHALPDLVIKFISETTNGVAITDTTHPPTSGNEGIILSQPGLAKTNYSPIVRPITSNKLNGIRESILKHGVKRKQTTITKMNENNQTETPDLME